MILGSCKPIYLNFRKKLKQGQLTFYVRIDSCLSGNALRNKT